MEPLSPEAATTVWPWAAACWNSRFSASITSVGVFRSQLPQLTETTLARFSVTMLRKTSVPSSQVFGPW